MKRTFKGHIRFFVFVFALIIVASLVTTVICAREYKFPVYHIYDPFKVTGTEYTTQND